MFTSNKIIWDYIIYSWTLLHKGFQGCLYLLLLEDDNMYLLSRNLYFKWWNTTTFCYWPQINPVTHRFELQILNFMPQFRGIIDIHHRKVLRLQSGKPKQVQWCWSLTPTTTIIKGLKSCTYLLSKAAKQVQSPVAITQQIWGFVQRYATSGLHSLKFKGIIWVTAIIV